MTILKLSCHDADTDEQSVGIGINLLLHLDRHRRQLHGWGHSLRPWRPNMIVDGDLHQLHCPEEGFDQDRPHPKAISGQQFFCHFLVFAAIDTLCS